MRDRSKERGNVIFLVGAAAQAAESGESNAALHYSQAALNAANALLTLDALQPIARRTEQK